MNKYNSNNQQDESVAEETMRSSMLPAEIMESIDEFIRTKDDVSLWIPRKQIEARLYEDYPWLK